MAKLITLKQFADILNISTQSLRKKIERGSLPSGSVVKMEVKGNQECLRINLDAVLKAHPKVKELIPEEGKIKKDLIFNERNLIKVSEFAKKTGLSVPCIYDGINSGLYPHVEMPVLGEKRSLRILKNKLIEKYPQLKIVFES